jgi:hypothetical protein
MRSSIRIVDVDSPGTWTRYRAGLCDSCQANCCTMPLEVRLPDLVRLGLVDAFEAEHEEAGAHRQTAAEGAADRPLQPQARDLHHRAARRRRLPLSGRRHAALHGV